jgi:three-Cys-motif partner protein
MGLACRAGENLRFHVNSQLKHYILQDYLSAWLPIMGSFADILTYVDCFAGTGACDFNGTLADGSPLVALRTINRFLRQAPSTVRRPSKVNVVFVEVEPERHKQLETAIRKFSETEQLDSRISCSVLRDDAQSALSQILPQTSPTAPAFYFIDPNYRLPDMKLMRQLMSRKKTEVFANFMFCEVVRNMANALDNDNMIALFGDNGYQAADFSTGSDHYAWDKVIDFYAMRAGAQYYIPFRVCFGPDEDAGLRGRLKYVLIHLSNHFTAFDKMLTAMYANSEPDNSLQVSMKQPTLFPTLEYNHLIERVKAKYRGTGAKMSFDALREENWRFYASEQIWRRCLKALRTEGVVVSHHVTSKTDVGLRQKDIVEFPRG